VKIAEKVFAKPLRDFGDYQEIRESDRDHFFSVWIERDSELVEGIVAIIPASKGPILCIERGKKEKAIATAVLRKGTGAITVNGRPLEGYFERAPLKAKQFLWRLLALPHVREALSQMEVSIEVTGSNPSTVQQVKASAHALARALMKYDSRLRPLLRRFEGVKVKKT
jgi:small subunit ribosomal protein S9